MWVPDCQESLNPLDVSVSLSVLAAHYFTGNNYSSYRSHARGWNLGSKVVDCGNLNFTVSQGTIPLQCFESDI